jgi:lipopolysaccharide transport system permease protein
MNERRYTPRSELRQPLRLLCTAIRDLKAARYLAWRILVRDLSARYRQTLLGYLWIVIPPVAVALGMTLAMRSQILRISETDLPYPAYLIFSMSLWQTFAEALAAPPSLIQKSRSVLARIYFPREALLIAGLGDVLVNFAVRVLLILSTFVLFDVSLTWGALLAVPVAAVLILLAYGLGLLVAPFASLYHDLSRAITIGLMIWLFFSPVLYPVPAADTVFGTLVRLNPVTPLLVTARELAIAAPLSMAANTALIAVLSLIALGAGWLVCKVSMPFVIERLRA